MTFFSDLYLLHFSLSTERMGVMMLIKAINFIKETIKTHYSYHVTNPGTAQGFKNLVILGAEVPCY